MQADFLYFLSAVSGLVDVDAITLSVAAMAKLGETTAFVATLAIALPAAVNTVVKIVIAWAMSGRRMALCVAAPLILALMGGVAALWAFGH